MQPDAVGPLTSFLHIDPEVAEAIGADAPIVALESTIFSQLGLPAPYNRHALDACHQAVRANGAVPAMIAIVDGTIHVGVADDLTERILAATNKVAARDIGAAIATSVKVGVTTVSATVAIASLVGISTFATGGIGGVHRDHVVSSDISADLDAIAGHPVIVVSSGAKSFLDLGATLEHLETKSVPVLGWQTDRFPAFTAADSGYAAPTRVDTADTVAATAHVHWALGAGGILVAVPPPEPIDPVISDTAIEQAEQAADAAEVTGPARTPFVLEKMAEFTDGASIASNIALAANNAAVAATIATALHA